MGLSASYWDLQWFQKFEDIPVDFLNFLESKNRFLASLSTKWRENENEGEIDRRNWRFFCKKNRINLDNPFPTFLFFRKFPEIIVGPHNLFFQSQKKAASYGVIGKLYQKLYTSMLHGWVFKYPGIVLIRKKRDRFSEELVAIFRGLQVLILIFKIGLFIKYNCS